MDTLVRQQETQICERAVGPYDSEALLLLGTELNVLFAKYLFRADECEFLLQGTSGLEVIARRLSDHPEDGAL